MSEPATQQEVLHSRATSAAKRTPKPGSGTGKSHCTDEALGAAAFTTGLDHPDRSSRNRRMSHSTPGTGIPGSAMFNSAIKLDSSVGTMERGSINRPVNPTPMPEQKTYRPQAEHIAEQPQNRPTPEAGVTQVRPENEVAANPRILALMQERDDAERRLQEAILDLETREQSPAFQKAKELFETGMRLKYNEMYDVPKLVFGSTQELDEYGLDADADTRHEFMLRDNLTDLSKEEISAGTKNMAQLFEAMQVDNLDHPSEAVYHLLNISSEVKPTSRTHQPS